MRPINHEFVGEHTKIEEKVPLAFWVLTYLWVGSILLTGLYIGLEHSQYLGFGFLVLSAIVSWPFFYLLERLFPVRYKEEETASLSTRSGYILCGTAYAIYLIWGILDIRVYGLVDNLIVIHTFVFFHWALYGILIKYERYKLNKQDK